MNDVSLQAATDHDLGVGVDKTRRTTLVLIVLMSCMCGGRARVHDK
jgi:hypothetical protein